jgi:hypothetical protein
MTNLIIDLVNRCPECKKYRMNTPSGSVCPDGHGKIYRRVPEYIGGVTVPAIVEPKVKNDDDDDDWDDDDDDDWDDDDDDWDDDDDEY